jgi:PP-loop superfamily ATP-utilizing enzyme
MSHLKYLTKVIIMCNSEFDSALEFVSELTNLSSRLYCSNELKELGVDCYEIGALISRLAQKVSEHASALMMKNWKQSIKEIAVKSASKINKMENIMSEYKISLFNDKTLEITTMQIQSESADEAIKSIEENELKNNTFLNFIKINGFPLCIRLNDNGTEQRIYR